MDYSADDGQSDSKNAKPNKSAEDEQLLVGGNASGPNKIRPPLPHHDTVYVMNRRAGLRRWHRVRKYCVIATGFMKLYAKSTDPYKNKDPQRCIDLSAAKILVVPKELKLVLSNKESEQVLKTKNRIHFDRLLENLHNHRSYGLMLTAAKQSMDKRPARLGETAKKEMTSTDEMARELGRMVKDLDWIINTTAAITAPLISMQQTQMDKAKARQPLGKRIVRFSKMPIRSKLKALGKKVAAKKKKSKTMENQKVQSENSHGVVDHQQLPEAVMTNLKEYLVAQENFVQLAKLFHEKAQQCATAIERAKSKSPAKKDKDAGGAALSSSEMETAVQDLSEDTSNSDSADVTSPVVEAVDMQKGALSPAKATGAPTSIGRVDDCARTKWDLYTMPGAWLSTRKGLPASMTTIDISLWSLLKQCLGQNLTRISLPVIVFEPLNMLQVVCEELEYSWLLDKAAIEEDPYMRMAYIAVFAASRYKSTQYRTGRKPFNPILGETYECIRQDLGWRFIGEQVSHHPPISACHAESDQWIFTQSMSATVKFWGYSIEATPTSSVHLYLKQRKEEYVYNKPNTSLHRLLSEHRYYEHHGEMNFTCESANKTLQPIRCSLHLLKDYYKKNEKGESVCIKGDVVGEVLNEYGKVVLGITGNWTRNMCVNGTLIWKPHTYPADYDKFYGFTEFALSLNDLPNDDVIDYLPSTDSRFRPDQRMVELGKWEAAELKKQELEVMQRNKRKQLALAGQKHKTKWFKEHHAENGTAVFAYGGQYWDARSKKFAGYKFDKLWT